MHIYFAKVGTFKFEHFQIMQSHFKMNLCRRFLDEVSTVLFNHIQDIHKLTEANAKVEFLAIYLLLSLLSSLTENFFFDSREAARTQIEQEAIIEGEAF